MNNQTYATGGTSFAGLLTITFAVLKLCGTISWPWLWVLSPIWIPLALAGASVAVLCVVLLLVAVASIVISDK